MKSSEKMVELSLIVTGSELAVLYASGDGPLRSQTSVTSAVPAGTKFLIRTRASTASVSGPG